MSKKKWIAVIILLLAVAFFWPKESGVASGFPPFDYTKSCLGISTKIGGTIPDEPVITTCYGAPY